MKIEHFKQIIEIEKTGSISKAAQNLFMSQSNLSLSIKNLEQEFNNPIFIRSNKGIYLTPFGKKLFDHSKSIVSQFEQVESLCFNHKEHGESEINLSISSYYLLFVNSIFNDLINKYSNENINFILRENTRLKSIEDVESKKSDLGILVMPISNKSTWLKLLEKRNLEYKKLSVEKPHILIGEKNPLYDRNLVEICEEDLSDLIMNFPCIKFSEESDVFDNIEFELVKSNPSKIINVCDRGSLINIIRNTNSFYIATKSKFAYNKVDFYESIKAIPIKDPPNSLEIGLIKNKSTVLPDICLEFVHMIGELFK